MARPTKIRVPHQQAQSLLEKGKTVFTTSDTGLRSVSSKEKCWRFDRYWISREDYLELKKIK